MRKINDTRIRGRSTNVAASNALIVMLILPVSLAAQEIDPAATNIDGPPAPIVDAGDLANTTPPSDAIVLFDGTSTEEWEQADTGDPVQWVFSDGEMTVRPGTSDIRTKRAFGDVQLHIEWRVPPEPSDSGQSSGNSGIYLQDRYNAALRGPW